MMHRQMVLAWALVAVAGSGAGGPVAAQDRGYGSGYDAGLNYLQPSPAYDPFYNEGSASPDQRYMPPPVDENRDYAPGSRPRAHRGIFRVRKAAAAAVKRVKPSGPALWLSDKP